MRRALKWLALGEVKPKSFQLKEGSERTLRFFNGKQTFVFQAPFRLL